MPRQPVAVLHQQVSATSSADDLDVLAQADFICGALGRLGRVPRNVPFDLDLKRAADRLQRLRPQVVFNLVESIAGNGQLIHLAPALLEHLGLPYTGAPLQAMFLSTDKLVAKRLMHTAAIPTPVAMVRLADGTLCPIPGRASRHAHPRWIVKPLAEDASVGIDDDAIVSSQTAARRLMDQRWAERRGLWFAEHYVTGREINVSLIQSPQGLQVLPVAEIEFQGYPKNKPHIVSYAAKWQRGSFEYTHTPRRFLDGERTLVKRLEKIARQCWELFGFRGYARVDFRVDGNDIWVLEANANPCLAPDAGFMAAVSAAGIDPEEAVRWILEDGEFSRMPQPAPRRRRVGVR